MTTPKSLADQLREALSFKNPDVDGSDFHCVVINKSICHTKRRDPAWAYSIRDAVVGVRLENTRLQPILSRLIECAVALEKYESVTAVIDHNGGDWAARKALTALRETLTKERE